MTPLLHYVIGQSDFTIYAALRRNHICYNKFGLSYQYWPTLWNTWLNSEDKNSIVLNKCTVLINFRKTTYITEAHIYIRFLYCINDNTNKCFLPVNTFTLTSFKAACSDQFRNGIYSVSSILCSAQFTEIYIHEPQLWSYKMAILFWSETYRICNFQFCQHNKIFVDLSY